MIRYRRIAVAVILVAAAAVLPAAAAPVPSQGAGVTAARTHASAVAAERALLQASLAGFGLTERAAADRVALLTDEEVHAVVGSPESLRVVAGSTGETVAVAVVMLLLLYGVWFVVSNG